MKQKSGYDPEIVIAFLDAHGEREDGAIQFLNERRLESSMRRNIIRWEIGDILVPLNSIDRLLMRHGLMLYELDHWATEHYGRTGWFDPYEEPLDLVG